LKKIYSLIALCLIMIMIVPMTVSASSYRRALYTDVRSDHWAYDAIKYVSDWRYFGGYQDGTFLPNKSITRAEAAKVLASYMYLIQTPATQSSFADVEPGMWYVPYVEAMKPFFPGAENERFFRPNDPMTREDTICILVNANQLQSKVQFVDMSLAENFTDSDEINAELKAHLAIAIQSSLISGYSDGSIKPQNALSRAEFATLLYRANAIRNQ